MLILLTITEKNKSDENNSESHTNDAQICLQHDDDHYPDDNIAHNENKIHSNVYING